MTRRTRAPLALAFAFAFAACAAEGADAPPTGSPLDGGPPSATDAPSTTAPTATTTTATSQPTTTAPVVPTATAATATAPRATAAPTTTTAATTTVATTAAVDIAACAASLPLRERVALLVWPSVYSDDWDTARRTVENERVGGVLLMTPTGWGPDDVTTHLARLEAAAPRGLIVAIDEEGGDVQRLSVLGPLPSQESVSEDLDPDRARLLIAEHGRRLAAAGVDMVLGPVVDVVPRSGDVPLSRSRFFTGEPPTVAAFARAYVEGWQSSGLSAVIKHYPGHGAASGDTHEEPGVTPGLDELEEWDLVPFRALADTGVAVMVGHLTVPGLTDGRPATQSERAVRYLRDDLGYGDALVMTDALGMQAVGLPEDEAAVLALVAGIDVVIFTATGQTRAVVDAIERAVADGTLTDERITLSAARVLRLLDPRRTGCGSG